MIQHADVLLDHAVFHILQMERQRLEVDAEVDALHFHAAAQLELDGRRS
jgi:hypothetical protein